MSSAPHRFLAASTIVAALAVVGSVQGQCSAIYRPSPSGLPKTTENGQSEQMIVVQEVVKLQRVKIFTLIV